MKPLRIIRRFHAPLACLAIACVFSAGCNSRQEVISLGQPTQAYRADDGSVLLGYHVQPTIKPGDAGWHWLVIEPATADLLMQAPPSDASAESSRTIVVSYSGWSSNARLIPPLLEPGMPDRTPPVVGGGGLSGLLFTWDNDLQGIRLLSADGQTLPILRVSPGFATLRVTEYDAEVMLDVLRVVAVAAVVAGLIVLGGSAEFSTN